MILGRSSFKFCLVTLMSIKILDGINSISWGHITWQFLQKFVHSFHSMSTFIALDSPSALTSSLPGKWFADNQIFCSEAKFHIRISFNSFAINTPIWVKAILHKIQLNIDNTIKHKAPKHNDNITSIIILSWNFWPTWTSFSQF